MTYEYEIRKKAVKFIRQQERKQQLRIFQAIYTLPLLGDVKKMKSETNVYRLRVGSYRILFELNPKSQTVTVVTVTDADNRGQIYK